MNKKHQINLFAVKSLIDIYERELWRNRFKMFPCKKCNSLKKQRRELICLLKKEVGK